MTRITHINVTHFKVHFRFQGTFYQCERSRKSIKSIGKKLGMEWYEMDELCRALQEQQEKQK